MNILLLTKHLNAGGITSYLFNLSQGLINQGHAVFFVSSGGKRESDFRQLGVRLTNLDLNTKSNVSLKIFTSLKPIKNIISENNIDIIHSHTRVTQIIGTLLAKRTKAVHVSTCHGFFKPKLCRKIFPCWGARTIAISEAVRKHLIDDFNVSQQCMDVITNGISLDQYKISSESQKQKGRLDYNITGNPVIGIVARLSDVKGQDRLLEAFARVLKTHPKACLLIVGEGPMQSKLLKIRESLQLESSVIFLPVVNQSVKMIGLLDIFVNPSYQEGLGLSVMEAQTCGVPVVATDVGGVVSLIEHNQTGLLVSNSQPHEQLIQALSDAICRLIEDKELYAKVRQQALDCARDKYSADIMTQKTIQFYKNAIAQ